MHRDGPKQPKDGFDFEAWLAKHQKFAVEHLDNWVAAVKEKYGQANTKYACVGYCFGAPYVMSSLTPRGSEPPVRRPVPPSLRQDC